MDWFSLRYSEISIFSFQICCDVFQCIQIKMLLYEFYFQNWCIFDLSGSGYRIPSPGVIFGIPLVAAPTRQCARCCPVECAGLRKISSSQLHACISSIFSTERYSTVAVKGDCIFYLFFFSLVWNGNLFKSVLTDFKYFGIERLRSQLKSMVSNFCLSINTCSVPTWEFQFVLTSFFQAFVSR